MADTPFAGKTGLIAAIQATWQELKTTFAAFGKAPRALWGINLPYITEGLVYFGTLTILGKFCSENVRLSDLHSGWVYGGVTGGITFAMLVLGGVTDRIGVRRSLALALGTMMVGRFLIALSGTLPLGHGMGSPMFFLMGFGLLLMVTAYGLYQPAAYAGVRRYTNPRTAAVGYGLIYGLMNLGAFASGFISSGARHRFAGTFPPNGLPAVFWIYTVITLLGCLATLLIITRRADRLAHERSLRETKEMEAGPEEKAAADGSAPPPSAPRINPWPFLLLLAAALTSCVSFFLARSGRLAVPPLAVLLPGVALLIVSGWEFLRHRPDHPFRDLRFVFFIFILIPVQTLFAHTWLTVPYYLDRAFSGTTVSQNFEVFSNINPVLIFVLSPLIAALTARANIYRMMILGTLVMALPTFLLALGPNVFLFLVYVLLMSVGEAMWQPRFLQWIAEIAPPGKTGAYMGIGQFPWFLTKFLTATYSGWFIANYCPIPGPEATQRTGTMWLIYGIIAMVTPVTLLLARRWMIRGMKSKA
ncbi:MAG TPA: MFS transporter [Candidatus Aminicenantes bacterium]|nr:MFS transporter [Candidatus Aminicenantes bacterium]